MSLIEGIGDEVTVLFTCLLVITVIVVAWMSTHVDVRTLTSVVIIDRERFAELLRRVRGIAVRNNFGETDAHVTSHSSASAAAAHAATDSLLVSGAAAGDYLNDAKPQSSCGDGAHNYRSSDGEHGCSHESEACGSSDNASNNTDSVSPLPEVGAATATAATCNKTSSQCSSAMGSDIPPGSIQVRLQFVDGCQRTVIANPDDTIGHFKRYVCNL